MINKVVDIQDGRFTFNKSARYKKVNISRPNKNGKSKIVKIYTPTLSSGLVRMSINKKNAAA